MAECVCESLESNGFRCWLSARDMLPGVDRGEAVMEAMDASQLMILIFSSHSNHLSDSVHDVRRAAQNGFPVLPFRIEPVGPSEVLQPYFEAVSPVEAYAQSLPDALHDLVQRVTAYLGQRAVPQPQSQISPVTLIVCGIALVVAFGFTIVGAYSAWNRFNPPKVQPLSRPVTTRSSFEDYLDSGRKQLDSGNYREAVSSFDLALRADSKNPETYYLRGQAYAKLGQTEKAIQDYNSSLHIKPDNPDALNDRGVAHAKLDQHDDAVSDFSKAIQMKPEEAVFYNNRAQEQSKLGKHDQAVSDYEKAKKLNPNIVNASASADYYEHGLALNQQRQYTPAIHDFTEAIRLDPKHSKAYNQRGFAYQNLGNLDQAVFDYTVAIKIDPRFAEPYCNRGAIYFRQGLAIQGKQDFDQCGKLDPGYKTWIHQQLQNELQKQSQSVLKKFKNKFKKIF